MDLGWQRWIEQFHGSSCRCVLALTGGGSLAAAQLLQVPGGSRTLLEVVIPYDDQATVDFLGQRPEQFCSEETSRALAQRAVDRARWLAPGAALLGLGCTASLVSAKPKRGEHRCYVSTSFRERMRTWSLTLTRGARSRAGEEALTAGLVLHVLARTLGLPLPPPLPLLEEEVVQEATALGSPLAELVGGEGSLYVDVDGSMRLAPPTVTALLPGSFNPVHAGHWGLAEAAADVLQMPVAFELSIANVDKPELDTEEVRRRLGQFTWRAPVWLTRAAKFVQKAKAFPGAAFVVGADTAERIVAPRYYDNDPARMLGALELFAQLGCRFLVAGRLDPTGRCLQLEDLAIPADYRRLFTPIPPDRFRLDISSTALRELHG